jgi:integrase
LKRIRFHDLRHTFGTTMAGAGEDLITVQHWMGHAHQSTTEIYAHYRPKPHGAKKIGEAFGTASEPPALAVPDPVPA